MYTPYCCKKEEITGAFVIPKAKIPLKSIYITVRPSVYKTPYASTAEGFDIFFATKDTAVIFVANGHGLIEVNTPKNREDKNIIISPIKRH